MGKRRRRGLRSIQLTSSDSYQHLIGCRDTDMALVLYKLLHQHLDQYE